MRRVRVFLYIIKQGFEGLLKNGFMIFASISVIFVSLFILGSLYLASLNLQHFMDKLADEPQIRVDLETETTEERIEEIKDIIEKDSRVDNVHFVDKEEQYKRFLETFEDREDLFEGYGPELLFVSFEIKLKDINFGKAFTKDMKQLESVEYVRDILNIVSIFTKVKDGIELGGWVVFGVMGILSVLLVINTIKLTVIARKKELEIMKYIGASETYTRGPFVIEGIFIGVVGAAVAFYLVRYVYGLVSDFFMEKAFFNSFIQLIDFNTSSGNLLIYFMASGIIVGVFSSAFAIRKYIKV